MKYEHYEGYPQYDEGHPFGTFGYPSAMLDMSLARDDIEGFRFYFDRYFSLDSEVFGGGTLIEYAKRRGAEKVAKELKRMGAK